jgi:putative phage-type endonuclease
MSDHNRSIESLGGPVRQIGGSDAAPACGVEVYGKNRITLWEELTGRRPRMNQTSRPIRRGNTLEDWIGQEYALETGVTVRRRLKPFTNPKFPWMRGNIDRRVTGQRVLLECKSVHPMALMRGEEWGESGSDEVPLHYLLQCVHYNVVADALRTDLAAMFGDELRIYRIERNAQLEARLIELESQVWQAAERDEAPMPMTAAEVRTLHPGDDGSSIIATPLMIAVCEWLYGLKLEYTKAKAEADMLTGQIEVFMAECAELIDESGAVLATWKKAKNSTRTDWRALAHEFEQMLILAHDTLILPSLADVAAARLHADITTPGSRRFLLKKRAQ